MRFPSRACPRARGSLPLPYRGRRVSSRCANGGEVWGALSVRGPRPAAGAVPRRWSSPIPLCLPPGVRGPACWASDHSRLARPSPAPPLVWGLRLRRRRVPRVVAPVGEGGAQGPGEPVVGLRVRDAEHRPPLKENRPCRLPVGPPRPNHGPDDPFVVLSGHPPSRGTSRLPQSLPRNRASKGRFLNPLVVPEVAQLSHLYTSITRGRASPPSGSGIASRSRAQSPRAPSAPVRKLAFPEGCLLFCRMYVTLHRCSV